MNRYLQWPGIISTVLVTGSAVCVVALGIETNWGREFRRDAKIDPMRPAKAAEAAMLPTAALPPLDAGYPESGARPLFMPTRRPVPAAAPAAAMKRGQFVLVGTSRTKEFGDSALLKEIATNKTSIVAAGATIKDMVLAEVGPDKVLLKLGDETEELVMKAKAQARPPGAPTPPGPIPARPGMPSGSIPAMPPSMQSAPGAGIFGGPAPAPAPVPVAAQNPVPIAPGAPGSPTVFPGAPGSAIVPGAAQPATQPRAPTPEEILERRRRARAQQAQ